MSNDFTHIRVSKVDRDSMNMIALKVSATLGRPVSTGEVLNGLLQLLEPKREKQAESISNQLANTIGEIN